MNAKAIGKYLCLRYFPVALVINIFIFNNFFERLQVALKGLKSKIMSDKNEDFKEFIKRRESAANAYVSGDPQPLDAISARENPVTFFSPGGDYTSGARKVAARYKKDSASFEKGSETHFEILQMDSSGDLAFWVGLQKASAKLKGKKESVPFNLRITEIFRRENGEWKLIQRHADELKIEDDKKK